MDVKDIEHLSKKSKTYLLKDILTGGEDISEVFIKHPEIMFALIPELECTYKVNQNNKYHKHDVYEHCLAVTDACKSNKFEIKLAALLHDIGKPHCISTDANGYNHFHGHPEVSYLISIDALNNLYLSADEKQLILNLIKYHDTSFFVSDTKLQKALDTFGESFLRDLIILQAADESDHILPEGCEYPSWWIPIETKNKRLDDLLKEI